MPSEPSELRGLIEALGRSIEGVSSQVELVRSTLEDDRRDMVEIRTRLARAEADVHKLTEAVLTGNGSDPLRQIASRIARDALTLSARVKVIEDAHLTTEAATKTMRGTIIAAAFAAIAAMFSAAMNFLT